MAPLTSSMLHTACSWHQNTKMPSSNAVKLCTILDFCPFLLRRRLVWNHRHSTATAQCCGCTGRRLQGDEKARRHKQRLQLFEGHSHRHGKFLTMGHFPGCKHYWMCYMHLYYVCLSASMCEQYLSPASIEISWLLFMPIGSALPSPVDCLALHSGKKNQGQYQIWDSSWHWRVDPPKWSKKWFLGLVPKRMRMGFSSTCSPWAWNNLSLNGMSELVKSLKLDKRSFAT